MGQSKPPKQTPRKGDLMERPPNKTADPLETEIKLTCSEVTLDQLKSDAHLIADSFHQTLRSTYFDTEDYRLYNAGAVLRLRTGGSKNEQTLKLPSVSDVALVTRSEWTCFINKQMLDITQFPRSALRQLQDLAGKKPLQAFAKTIIEREQRTVQSLRSQIDVAFDRVQIQAAGQSQICFELELELKRGTLADVFCLARWLPLGPELAWSTHSKGARAIRLATGLEESPRKPSAAPVDASMTVAEAFGSIAGNCLNQLLHNYRLVVERSDAEALHQCRVALRRLRVTASVFEPVAENQRSRILITQWKAVASALGHGRHLDVLIARKMDDRGDDLENMGLESDANSLLQKLRAKTYVEIVALLSGQSFQRMLIDTALWIEAGANPGKAMRVRPDPSSQIADLAARALQRRWKQVKKMIGEVESLGPKKRHRLRIRAKSLRYASQFLEPILVSPGNQDRYATYAGALEELTDRLGELNDIAVSTDPAVTSVAGLDQLEGAIVLASLDHSEWNPPRHEKKLAKAARKAGEVMLRTGRFWN
jgi:inorganic triphosphatase YgiF